MANEYVVTTVAAEVLDNSPSKARAVDVGAEVLHTGAPQAQATMIGVEVLRTVAVTAAANRRRAMICS